MTEDKQALRTHFLSLRRQLLPREKQLADRTIADRVLRNGAYQAAGTVFCYAALPYETDTKAILLDALQNGKRLALPRCGANGRMQFYAVQHLHCLKSGTWGIPEPDESCALLLPDAHTVCIVPALARDNAGFRLGHGGGYYDRYLAAHPVHTIGLCYAFCKVPALPTEPFDIPLDEWID